MYASVPGTSPTAVSVSASSNWASPKSSNLIEIVGAASTSTFDGFTSRWTIPMRVRARARRASARRLDRVAVAELPAAQRLPQRAALYVLVRDVDVAAVAAEVVGANAALVAQT